MFKNKKISTTILLFALFSLLNPFWISGQEPIARIKVNPGKYNYYNTPVYAVLKNININDIGHGLTLTETTSGKALDVPFQLEKGMQLKIWWILEGETAAGKERSYVLKKADNNNMSDESMGFDYNQKSLTLTQNGKKVLNYRHAIQQVPDGVDEKYARGGFIHPLYSPSGNILTRIQPPDHYHHYGIWNPWTKTHFDGKEIDFWNLVKGQGTIEFTGFAAKVSGPVYSGFKVLHNHLDLIGDTTAMNETWDVRIWKHEYHGKTAFLCDFTTTLNCATDKQIELAKYRYGGGIGFRATEEWNKDNTTVLTSEGKSRKDADASRARWCIVKGDFPGNGTSGVLFMSHPSNYEYPEPMRVWPLDAAGGRGDMFFQFCPIRHTSWEIKPGNLYTLKYRMFIFDGDFLNKEGAEELWNDFAREPEVVVELGL